MAKPHPFKWRHYEPEIILLCVRWYLRYSLSYRDVTEMMHERGLTLDHTTIFRWVQRYAPELEKRSRPYLRPTNDSYRVDETYIRVKKRWKYLYRAVDSKGNTIDFMLSAKRDAAAAKRFFRKALKSPHNPAPRVISVDKNPAYPPAVDGLKTAGTIPEECGLRQVKYLNNIVEQDHRFINRRVSPRLGFCSFMTAWRTIQGYEAMHMIRKGQVEGTAKGEIGSQVAFISTIFGIAA